MSHDEYTKLFKYMEVKFGAIDKRFDGVEVHVGNLEFAMAEFGGQIKDLREEVLAIAHNDSRQNRWIKKLSDHAGCKLSPA